MEKIRYWCMLAAGQNQEGVNHEDYRFESLFAEALKKCLPEEDPERYMPYEIWDETPENREHPNRKTLDTFTYPCGDIAEKAFISLNGGTLNFLIRSEDLQKQDFSKVLAQWACS